MKSFLMILLLISLSACGHTSYFIPCRTGEEIPPMSEQLLPLKTGNRWFYNEVWTDPDKDTVFGEKTLEIGDLVKTHYYDIDKIKHPIKAYRLLYKIVQPGTYSGEMLPAYAYFAPCSEGSIYCFSDEESYPMILAGYTILNKPKKGFSDKRYKDAWWNYEGNVKVPAGEFASWSVTYQEGQNFSKQYYSKGVGMVKSELINKYKGLLARSELVNYLLVE